MSKVNEYWKATTINGVKCIIPHNSEAFNTLRMMKQEVDYIGHFQEDRNPKFHRLFMGLLRILYNNCQDPLLKNEKKHKSFVLLEIGCVDVVKRNGITYAIAKSLAYDNMSQKELATHYEHLLDYAVAELDLKKIDLHKKVLIGHEESY